MWRCVAELFFQLSRKPSILVDMTTLALGVTLFRGPVPCKSATLPTDERTRLKEGQSMLTANQWRLIIVIKLQPRNIAAPNNKRPQRGWLWGPRHDWLQARGWPPCRPLQVRDASRLLLLGLGWPRLVPFCLFCWSTGLTGQEHPISPGLDASSWWRWGGRAVRMMGLHQRLVRRLASGDP